MGIRDQIESDLKIAMKAGETLRRDTLRMVIAAFKNKAIELEGTKYVLSEDEALAVLANAVKTRTDSATQYDAAGRPELADRERAEIAVIQGYLPKALSEADTITAVEAAIRSTGAASKADVGKVIKAVMAAHKGRADGKLVQQLAAARLA